jgi:YVTN family beta-propeller protein
VSSDGSKIYVVNADADSVSEIDAAGRKLVREISLAPTPEPSDAGRYTPAVMPRALALSPSKGILWVTGERSGQLHGIDLCSGEVAVSVHVGSEPTGLVVAPDESAVYVACSNDGTVVRVDTTNPAKAAVSATAKLTDGTSSRGYAIQAEPWALGWSTDGTTLYATHMLAPNVSALDPTSLALKSTLSIPDQPDQGNMLIPNGTARGLYDVVARPGGSGELWVPHMMLDITTAQPSLEFDSTTFPTLSIFDDKGAYAARLSIQPNSMSVPGATGAFFDIVSGPHALEFTADGRWALMLDSASEDILAIDADTNARYEVGNGLFRQFSGHMLEGLVISPDSAHVYVDERNTSDVAFVSIDTSSGTIALNLDGPAVPRLAKDPMPPHIRSGQFLFNTANSQVVGITKNNWVACASCHIEGRTDAVTWRFLQGPRDTPSNAGGVLDTGFLFHTADRVVVTDYWRTIVEEQGGSFSNPADGGAPVDPVLNQYLDDIQTYVNFGIPAPIPPTTDPTLVAMGQTIFYSPDVGCSNCHSGPAHTDSGEGNGPAPLSLERHIQLHVVGTCNTGVYPDVNHTDEDGNPRYPCAAPAGATCVDGTLDCVGFNTPTLRGVASSPPYFHDGSAPTIYDALEMTKGNAGGVMGTGHMGDITSLTSAQLDALVEYVRSL